MTQHPEIVLRNYFHAKDENRPHVLAGVFTPDAQTFACEWLVAMSEKESKGVRVGCGRYEWVFDAARSGLASHLTITILAMQVLPPGEFAPVMAWVQALDYPWSTAVAARRSAPDNELVASVLRHLPDRAADA